MSQQPAASGVNAIGARLDEPPSLAAFTGAEPEDEVTRVLRGWRPVDQA